jgi:hypothetical protein
MKNVRLHLILFSLVFCPTIVLADVSWVEEVETCEEFGTGVMDFNQRLGNLSTLTLTQEAELAVVLEAACGPRFAACKFDICQDEESAEGKEEAQPQKTPEPTPTPAPTPEPDKDVEPPRIQTDPLAWLGQELSCDEFKDQIRARYGPLGPWDSLPPKTKLELQAVFDTACSSRFEHCDFKRCAKDKVEPAEGAEDLELDKVRVEFESPAHRRYTELLSQRAEAMRQYRMLFELLKKSSDRAIEARMSYEREKGIYWQRFVVPGEENKESMPRRKPRRSKVYSAGSR